MLAFRVVWIVDDSVLPVPTTDGTMPALKPFCLPIFPVLGGTDTSQMYVVYLVVVQYFLPLCVISVAYARIMYRVWFSKAPGLAVDGRDKIMNKNKKKVACSLVNATFSYRPQHQTHGNTAHLTVWSTKLYIVSQSYSHRNPKNCFLRVNKHLLTVTCFCCHTKTFGNQVKNNLTP